MLLLDFFFFILLLHVLITSLKRKAWHWRAILNMPKNQYNNKVTIWRTKNEQKNIQVDKIPTLKELGHLEGAQRTLMREMINPLYKARD